MEYQYRQGQILNVRAEKTSERVFYDALTSILSDYEQRFHLVDYTSAESIMFDGEDKLFGNDVLGAAPFYVVFLELSGGRLGEEEKKELQAKVIDLFSLYICFSRTDHCCQRKQLLWNFEGL